MINYTNRDWEKAKCCKVSPFILKSLTSFCMMGFKREPLSVFEDLMNQHIFGKRYILNPATNKPWILEESLFAHIWSNKLVTIADLYFNFNQN